MRKTLVFLLLVVLLGAFLRFYRLDENPPSLFGDEVDVGYHAFSILKTGRDYLGHSWPVYFHSLAEWRAPLFIYTTVPSIYFFGLNEWGVRVPAALFGVLGVMVIFFFTKEVLGKPRIGLIASLFLGLSPWHLQYSRAGFEITLILFLFMTGTTLFIRGIRGRPWWLLPASVFLALAPYTYSTASFFLPLLIILLAVFFRKELLKTKMKLPVVLAIIIFLTILFPITREILSGRATERFQFLSVFQETKLIEEIHLARKETLPEGASFDQLKFYDRLLHNRPLIWLKTIGNNYLQAFSTQFLFISGDLNRRHAVGKMGELFWIDLIFLLFGLIYLMKLKTNGRGFVLAWLLLAPIASSLTINGGMHASRLSMMLPPLMIITAAGLIYLIELFSQSKKGGFLFAFLIIFFITEIILYQHRYWVHYPKDSWRWWDIGLREGMTYIKQYQKKYSLVVMNDTFNHSLLHFLFWTAYPPDRFREEFRGDVHQLDVLPGIDGFRLGKFYFGILSEETKRTMGFVKVINPGMLYLISQQDEVGGKWDWRTDRPSEIELLKVMTNPYREPIYYLVTLKK
jgi:4-amino-4-deoxy-L-arabinose transferase-like glycosyltransferase